MTSIILIAVFAIIVAVLVFFFIKLFIAPQGVDVAQKLIAQGKYQAAIKLTKKLIAKKPRNMDAHYFLGKALLADKQEAAAMEEYKFVNANVIFEQTQILESTFRAEIAQLYLKFNQREEALKEFLLLIKMQPRNAENFYQAGRLFERRQKPEQAASYFQQAIRLNPRHSKAHTAMAMMFLRTRQYSEAIREFKTAIEHSREDYSLHYYLGKAYSESKDYPAALGVFEKALRSPEFRQKAYIGRGECFVAANNLEKAIDEFDLAIKCCKDERSPETLFARYSLADCCEKTRRIDRALIQWDAIALVDSGYKNVDAKISRYRDIQSSDSMKEYLTAAQNRFHEICRTIAEKVFSITDGNIAVIKNGCKISGQPKATRQATLLYFLRDPEAVGESVVRAAAEEIKESNAKQSVVCSASGFEPQAEAFAEGRLIELWDKEKLKALLKKAGI